MAIGPVEPETSAPIRDAAASGYHLGLAPTEEIPELSWPDVRLVRECIAGNEAAWAALIEKYKRLIYSIPVRRGFSAADAGDIFQSVVAELLGNLESLREPKALPLWLMRVTSHKCRQFRHQQTRETPAAELEIESTVVDTSASADELVQQGMRDQALRQALIAATPRCRELIRMLFFENAPRPYDEVAESLGLAIGSIGFIRRRCLERMRKYLVDNGY